MASWGLLVVGWAYLIGLLATGISGSLILGVVSVAGCGVLMVCVAAGLVVPRFWYMGPTAKQWWIAGLVGLLSASYCVLQEPYPAANDISKFESRQERVVMGRVLQMPQTTRQGKGRFFFEAETVRGAGDGSELEAPKQVSGKLYVTAPLWPSRKLYPGQFVALKGRINKVENARETDKSSFGEYLAKQRCFAKFNSHWVEFLPNQEPPQFSLWKLRKRIVTAQGRWLGEPAGNLLSAMTLGRKAVDLPFETRDSFIDAGLAHTLAASGFHVSLLLGLVLEILKTQESKVKAGVAVLALGMYVGLTGLQPSVVRASVMGIGALAGLVMQQKVKPLGCLLVAVNLILLCNPQWVWDAGFELSAMATLGLIVTVPHLMKCLECIPTNVATLLAVPIAAYIWTVPLQLYYFDGVPSYAVFLNGVATPLVVLISVGGFVSAIASSIVPVVGSAIAFILYAPIHLLIWLVELFNQLPGSSIEYEGFGVWKVVASYCVYGAITIFLWRRQSRETL